MFDAVNAQRDRRNRSPLRDDDALAALARSHAEDMVRRGYRSHTTPEGVTYRDRLEAAGLNPDAAGENWVYVPRSSNRPVQAGLTWFMNSRLHRRNVLSERYTRLGVGVARVRQSGYIFVLTFAGQELD
jgi:uncharacterized protein YkwD